MPFSIETLEINLTLCPSTQWFSMLGERLAHLKSIEQHFGWWRIIDK